MQSLARELHIRCVNARAWFVAGKSFWIWCALAVIVAFISHLLAKAANQQWTASDSVRWAGMAYQIVGIAYVAVGLNKARIYFERPGLFKAMLLWVYDARFMIIRRPPINISAHFEGASAAMQAGLVVGTVFGGTMEERVSRLEKFMEEVRVDLNKTSARTDEVERALTRDLKREQQARREGDSQNARKLEEAVIGGVHLEAAGVAFLWLGVVCGTIPNEVVWVWQSLLR